MVTSGTLRFGIRLSFLLTLVLAFVPASPATEPGILAGFPPGVVGSGGPHDVPRTDGAVEIDGKLDEPVWRSALKLGLGYETFPEDNIPARVQTVCHLAYDDAHVYVGCDAQDPDIDRIRARLSDRDSAFSDDFIGVVLDTFNDERRAFEFFVNPLGVQMDLTFDDVQGNEDSSWDAIWRSAGQMHSTGYSVEMAIPFSSLRFQSGEQAQTWGIDILRIYPRESRIRLGLNPQERGRDCYLCQATKIVGFDGATPGRNLEIAPTFTAVRTDSIGQFPSGGLEKGDAEYEPGLTVRWGITPSVTFSGTVNPDFSQVEADVARLDVNEAFTLFFPEKRPFFLESADLFDTPVSAVYTRNVSDPNWGAKLTTKQGKNAMGLFVAEDAQTTVLQPGIEGSRVNASDDNHLAGVFRYRRDLGESSAIGALFTAREGDGEDYHNRLFGIDTLIRPNGDHTLRAQILASDTRDVLDPAGGLGSTRDSDDIAYTLNYRYSKENYSVRGSHVDYGADFRADMGFVPRVGYRQTVVGGDYQWFGGSDRWFDRLTLGGDVDETHDANGEFVEAEQEMWLNYNGPKQSFVYLGGGQRNRRFNGVDFDQSIFGSFFEIRPAAPVYLFIDFGYSDVLDFAYQPQIGSARQGKQTFLRGGTTLRTGRHLRTSIEHIYRTLRLDDAGGRPFVANQTELRLVYQFNVRSFVRWISQYRDVDWRPELYADVAFDPEEAEADWFNQLLFSYKLNPQTALYVGYSDLRVDTFFDDGNVLQSNQLETVSRTLFVKFGYAWIP